MGMGGLLGCGASRRALSLHAEGICLPSLGGWEALNAEGACLGAGQIVGAQGSVAANAAAGAVGAQRLSAARTAVIVRPGAYRGGVGDATAGRTAPPALGGDQHALGFCLGFR